MLINPQRNTLLQILQQESIHITSLQEKRSSDSYSIVLLHQPYHFTITKHSSIINQGYSVNSSPVFVILDWYALSFPEVIDLFRKWTQQMSIHLDTPDLWTEAAKNAQIFSDTAEVPDDKFTRSELTEVQGQLRQLQQSFAAAALPKTASQKLIELTGEAAVKAEGLTKKDWQNWTIGGFISSITSLTLNPTQASEVLKLVKTVFGGLLLH